MDKERSQKKLSLNFSFILINVVPLFAESINFPMKATPIECFYFLNLFTSCTSRTKIFWFVWAAVLRRRKILALNLGGRARNITFL